MQISRSRGETMTHGSLFSGIGGFDLGFQRAGIRTVFQVEIDPYCRKVLGRHFPEAKRYEDIRTVLAGSSPEPVSIISGGFPCQPVSQAGKRKGKDDSRYLWPEMFRVIQALRPRWVVAENVYGLITHDEGSLLDAVYDDLEGEGYETLPPIVLPACAFGAPHRRDRVWLVAHAERSERRSPAEGREDVQNGHDAGREEAASGAGERRQDATDAGRARFSE